VLAPRRYIGEGFERGSFGHALLALPGLSWKADSLHPSTRPLHRLHPRKRTSASSTTSTAGVPCYFGCSRSASGLPRHWLRERRGAAWVRAEPGHEVVLEYDEEALRSLELESSPERPLGQATDQC